MAQSPEIAEAYKASVKEQVVHAAELSPSSRSELKSQSVLITGGCSGLGAAMAVAFAEAGCSVTAADVNVEKVDESITKAQAAGLRIQLVQCDVTSWDSQRAAFKQAVEYSPDKQLNHVVANAGVPGPSIKLPSDEGYQHPDQQEDPLAAANGIQVSLVGCYYSTQLAVHYLQNAREATVVEKQTPPVAQDITNSIILTGSLAAYTGIPQRGDYCAAKFGVRGLFKSMRNSLVKSGIRINMISPGYVLTPHIASRLEQVKAAGYRLARIEDVAEAAMLMAATKSMNGRSLSIVPEGIVDMRDDPEGDSGGPVMWDHIVAGTSTLDAA